MKKGFTLVELLAVIVILALVALITIPVILNVIEKSKIKTYQRSIDSYGGAVKKAIAEYLLDHEDKSTSNITYNDIKDYIKYEGNKVECTVNIYKDKTIYLEDCKVNNESVEYTYGEKEKTLCTLDGEKTGIEKINRGDKYKCEVIKGMKEPYTFYVLSVEDDKINLIMDRNICNDGTPADKINQCNYAWYATEYNSSYGLPLSDKSSNGPVTAMTELYNATKNWNNVPNMNLNYSDEGGYGLGSDKNEYGTIKTTELGIKITKKDMETEVTREGNQIPVILYEEGKPLKARLPKRSEVDNLEPDEKYCYNVTGSCPSWLVENLIYWDGANNKYSDNQNNGITNIYGYWLLSSSYPEHGMGYALTVRLMGIVERTRTSQDTSFGVRAVITVSKSDLS